MKQGWIEVWRDGGGNSTRRCTIERTPDAYAVDVFRGDTCMYSVACSTEEEARAVAADERLRKVQLPREELLDRCVAESSIGCSKAQPVAAGRTPSAAA